ncbi:MAG TPA: OmpA family protein [Gemmatirosa sp.]
MSRPVGLLVLALTLAATSPTRAAHAQGWLGKVKDKAKAAVDQTGGATAKAVTGVRDSAPAASATASTTPAPNGSAAAKPGEGAWANYDFKPGEKTLFADDFAQDVVGNFPRRLEFVNGSAEIVEWQGRRWLSSGATAEFHAPLGQVLPSRYTIEFDMAGAHAVVLSSDPKMDRNSRPANTDWFWFYDWAGGIKGDDRDAAPATGYHTDVAPVHVAIQVDGDYAKAYVNEKRVSNVPNARMPRSARLYVRLEGAGEKTPVMLANLRVMAGGRPLYDALATSGRVATQGIYFATASDQVRPESSPTLKEIGAMLADHPELKLTIEGHTDNVGDAAANQALSQRRADAVRQALVDTYHVDGARLTAKGMGASKPAATNTTAEGRQTNRRVELVRQ